MEVRKKKPDRNPKGTKKPGKELGWTTKKNPEKELKDEKTKKKTRKKKTKKKEKARNGTRPGNRKTLERNRRTEKEKGWKMEPGHEDKNTQRRTPEGVGELREAQEGGGNPPLRE